MNLGSRTIAGACLLLIGASGASATDFYAGKTIEMIVGSDVGGGYDIYTRAIARHIGRHIPGNPTMVVKNMPGAGSGRAASYLYSVAPKDGTTLAAIFPGVLVSPLLDDRPVKVSDEHKARILQPVDVAAAALFVASLLPHAHVPELLIKPVTQLFV